MDEPDLTDKMYKPSLSVQPGRNGTVSIVASLWRRNAPGGNYCCLDYSREAHFDISSGQILALADYFADGFDYMGYINDCLMLPSGLFDTGYELGCLRAEPARLRPGFSGLPADYADFYFIQYNGIPYLWFHFEADNPYFYYESRYDIALAVPLLHTFSPYGGCYADCYQYSEELLFGTMPAKLATGLRMDLGAAPETDAAFKQQLTWARGELERLINPDELPADAYVQLWADQRGDFITITAHAATAPYLAPLRYYDFGIFTCETAGRSAWEEILWPYVMDPDAVYYAAAGPDIPYTQRQWLRTYQPAKDLQILCIEKATDGYLLHLKEPSGALVDLMLSKDKYKEISHQEQALMDMYNRTGVESDDLFGLR